MWVMTVARETNSLAAISRLERSEWSSRNTSSSRSVIGSNTNLDDDFVGGEFFGGPRRDVLGGGRDDELCAVNTLASRDIVGCGAGRDSAEVDRKDVVG